MQTHYITDAWRGQGYEVQEVGDHVLELRRDGEVLARFSQTGVEVANILKEVQIGKYEN